jgi:Tol biopolymer transport system component
MARIIDRISMGFDGTDANGDSRNAAITENGRYVVFESDASNLVVGDTNNATDVFRYDSWTGETVRVSVGSDGEGNDASLNASVSAAGKYVVFESLADNLVAGDTNGLRDVFIRNLDTGITTLASEKANGDDASGGSYGSHNATVVTLDGLTYVKFASDATNLVGGDTNSLVKTYSSRSSRPALSTAFRTTIPVPRATERVVRISRRKCWAVSSYSPLRAKPS